MKIIVVDEGDRVGLRFQNSETFFKKNDAIQVTCEKHELPEFLSNLKKCVKELSELDESETTIEKDKNGKVVIKQGDKIIGMQG